MIEFKNVTKTYDTGTEAVHDASFTIEKGEFAFLVGASGSGKSTLIKLILKEEGINVRVVDICSIKPIDKEMIIKCAKETKKLISVEDHSVIGGIGTAISEVLIEEYPTKLIKIGVNDVFGKSGKADNLVKYFGLDSESIIKKIKE